MAPEQTSGAAPASVGAGHPRRVVLDTNVLLSLFVFADSRLQLLREQLDAGAWLALADERCLEEFRRVLAYPMFSLDPSAQAAVLAAYAVLTQRITAVPTEVAPLPQCKDPDDQKFLELARNGAADWLVTADKALLKLARRNRLRGLFGIVTPDAALGLIGSDAQPARLAAGA